MSILTFDAATVTFNGATVYFNGPPPGAFTADDEVPLVTQTATAGLRTARDTMQMRWRGE